MNYTKFHAKQTTIFIFYNFLFFTNFRFKVNTTAPKVNNDGLQIDLIMIIRDIDNNLQNVSNFLEKRSASKHKSRFFVIFEKTKTTGQWIQDTLRQFWKVHILNVVIIFWSTELNIYTYNPFLHDFNIRIKEKIHDPESLFYDKLNDLQGYEMKVSLVPESVRAVYKKDGKISGSDAFLASLLSKRLNSKFKYITSSDINNPYGMFFNNGSATGSLKDIMEDKVNFSLNTRLLIYDNFYKRVEPSISNGHDDICVMVPRPRVLLTTNLFRNFEGPVWMVTLISVLVMAKFWARFGPPADISRILIDVYGCLLSQPIVSTSSKLSQKIVITFWMIYCLLISSAYKGTLISSLSLPAEISDINTIAQLEQANLEILVLPNFYLLLHNYLNKSHPADQMLLKNLRKVNSAEYHRNLAANNLNVAYINRRHLTNYWSTQKEHTVNGRSLFNTMQECPMPFMVVYVFPYGSPLVGKFNQILRGVQEGGVEQYWEHFLDTFGNGDKIKKIHKDENDKQQLNLSHLQEAFYMLVMGLLVSVGAFCYEVNKYRQEHVKVVMKTQKIPVLFPYVN
jgi:hypothetical protein